MSLRIATCLMLAGLSALPPQQGNPPAADAAQRAETAQLRALLEKAEQRISDLESQLKEERSERLSREQEWLRFTQGLGELTRAAGVKTPEFPPPLAGEPSRSPNAAPAADNARLDRLRRGRALLPKLRALFVADELALDLLEVGEFQDGALGPVVLRELDADGRPYGTLCAERMHLEGSQSARTLTLVLEKGYERRGSERHAFDDPAAGVPESAAESGARRGTRRFELPDVDPTRWLESVPELFDSSMAAGPNDDGKHDRTALRVTLNLLLREDAAGGWWRLSGLGGVQQDVLRDIVLDGFDREGRVERKLFADRLTVYEESKGVQLLLEHGAQLRGDQKLPFLEDRYRIFLPQADPQAWAKAGVPLVRKKAIEPAPPKRD